MLVLGSVWKRGGRQGDIYLRFLGTLPPLPWFRFHSFWTKSHHPIRQAVLSKKNVSEANFQQSVTCSLGGGVTPWGSNHWTWEWWTMEPKYLCWRWLDTPCSSAENMTVDAYRDKKANYRFFWSFIQFILPGFFFLRSFCVPYLCFSSLGINSIYGT